MSVVPVGEYGHHGTTTEGKAPCPLDSNHGDLMRKKMKKIPRRSMDVFSTSLSPQAVSVREGGKSMDGNSFNLLRGIVFSHPNYRPST